MSFQYSANKFTIIRGTDVTLIVHPFNPDYSPMSLSGTSDQSTYIQKSDNTYLELPKASHYVMNTNPGLIRLSLSAEETELLKAGLNLKMQMDISFGSSKKIVLLESALTIIERLKS